MGGAALQRCDQILPKWREALASEASHGVNLEGWPADQRNLRGGCFVAYNQLVLTEDDKQWLTGLLEERLEKLETTMLTEFHKWASPVELRQRSHAAALRAHDAELESHPDRLKNLEGR